jgi:hypothetical protein
MLPRLFAYHAERRDDLLDGDDDSRFVRPDRATSSARRRRGPPFVREQTRPCADTSGVTGGIRTQPILSDDAHRRLRAYAASQALTESFVARAAISLVSGGAP